MRDMIRPRSGYAIGRWLICLPLMATAMLAAHAPARSATFAAVVPVIACDALKGAIVQAGTDPTRIESAVFVSTGAPTPYCEVKAYVSPQIRFELRLPMTAWRQRLLFNGCGDFCGAVRIVVPAAAGCVPPTNGEFAQVSTDLGAVPPRSNTAYVAQVRARSGRTDDFLRLYMLPGVDHCGGGNGPDRMDLLSRMMAWIEDGMTPGAVRAFKATEPAMERSIAPYPNI